MEPAAETADDIQEDTQVRSLQSDLLSFDVDGSEFFVDETSRIDTKETDVHQGKFCNCSY